MLHKFGRQLLFAKHPGSDGGGNRRLKVCCRVLFPYFPRCVLMESMHMIVEFKRINFATIPTIKLRTKLAERFSQVAIVSDPSPFSDQASNPFGNFLHRFVRLTTAAHPQPAHRRFYTARPFTRPPTCSRLSESGASESLNRWRKIAIWPRCSLAPPPICYVRSEGAPRAVERCRHPRLQDCPLSHERRAGTTYESHWDTRARGSRCGASRVQWPLCGRAMSRWCCGLADMSNPSRHTACRRAP
jgi:hypothetical protein